MKKKLILILALVLISVVSVLCTIAYLMEDVEVENVMTVGSVHIELLEYERVNTETSGDAAKVEAFEDDKLLLPAVTKAGFDYSAPTSFVNWEQPDEDEKIIKADYTSPIWDPASITNEHDKMVFVRNTGNAAAYVRLYFAFEAGNYVRFKRFQEAVRINYNEAKDGETPIWNWSWNETLVELGVGVKKERYFIATATYYKPLEPNTTTEISLSQIALHSDVTLEEARGFGDEYKVLVKAQAMQCDGFDSADAALEKGFGNAYPFKNVKEVTFTDLPTALHYLDADTSKTKLVGTDGESNYMVNSVTFGLTADHIDKVREYDGVLVANMSGEAVYTAYAYYVPTADGKYDIYVLADEWSIYAPADSQKLFCNMKALTKVDTSNLDVSQTTSMYRMFFNCGSLTTLEVGNWFAKGTDEEVNLQQAFYGCKALKSLELSNWSIKTKGLLKETFKNCSSLSGKLDLTGWDVSGITSMQYTFSGCTRLTEIDVSNWNVGNVSEFSYMFENCYSLNKLDVANWDVSSATNFHGLFSRCSSLKRIELSEWNVEKLSSALGMFLSCGSLTSLDLSGWNTANLVKTEQMFSKCGNLKTIYVGKDLWNMGSVTNSTNMFEECVALVGGSGTRYNSANVEKDYAIIDGGTSNPGYLTEKK